jgi:molybdopterin-guanine dinucleotide biosynthesis protein A
MPVPGLLLTGGASSRMGVPKAMLVVDGQTIAERAARHLAIVCDPVVEVGPGYSGLRRVDEDPPGQGPLAALVAGADAVGGDGPVLLLACDLPFVTDVLLGRLANWDGDGTVVPVDETGTAQLVCARYSREVIDRARSGLADGERSLRSLLRDADFTRVNDVDPCELIDVDTPEDAKRWGIERPGSLDP